VIESSEAGFDLVDRGSITGTYLNGRAVENARLGPGDTIEIGDILLTVQSADPGQPLLLRVETGVSEADQVEQVTVPLGTREFPMPAAPGEALKAPKVDYVASYELRRALLSKSALTIALALVAISALVVVFRAGRHDVFRPGDLSAAHTQVVADGVRLISDDNCQACHERWGGAPDHKCQACHKQSGHRSNLPDVGACGDCHAEHRQLRNLADVVQKQCVDCHRDLHANVKTVGDVTVANSITTLERDHPELRIVVPIDGVDTRVAIDTPAARSADGNALVFDHKCHLTGRCNKRTPTATNPNQEVETLDCASCHQTDEETGAMMPVSYEKSCARCHPLTFDNRFPPVPHDLDLQTVAGFIANAYSGNQSILQMSADEVTRVFAQGRSQVSMASTIVRSAQRTLEARCRACHELAPGGANVVPPSGATKWYRGTKVFDHRAHLKESMKTRCADCHALAGESQKVSDLSLPGIDSCKGCHRASGEYAGRGIETCQTCHYYHELSLVRGEGWTLQTAEIPPEMKLAAMGDSGSGRRRPHLFGLPFWAAITLPIGLVVLVGVAGVFVGAARSVAARPKGPPTLRGDTRRPETPPSPKQEPPRAVAEPKAEPPRREPEPPSMPDRTIALDISEMRDEISAPVPDRTIVAEYFGSISFVTGPLAGRRFAIDPEKGSYLGRDGNLADIVIDDGRVSRRHAWVGVRGDGVMVIDQNSTNGTFLEKEPSQRITEARLVHGDGVILGENAAIFRFEP
jgi:pSer/pThr/pTyr-binding forkhead associated (FHA) protein